MLNSHFCLRRLPSGGIHFQEDALFEQLFLSMGSPLNSGKFISRIMLLLKSCFCLLGPRFGKPIPRILIMLNSHFCLQGLLPRGIHLQSPHFCGTGLSGWGRTGTAHILSPQLTQVARSHLSVPGSTGGKRSLELA